MAYNKSLVILKPDAVKRNLIGQIVGRFEDKGLKVLAMEMIQADDATVRSHYQSDNRDYVLTIGHVDVSGKSSEELEQIYQKNIKIVENLQQALQSGPVVKIIFQGGEDTVPLIRQIVGKTDPAKSDPGTIRGDLGEDSFEQSDKEARAVWNLVHASGNDEEAQTEIKLWFGEEYL